MRYAIASAASALLVGGMVALCYAMPAKKAAWEASGYMPFFSERLLAAGADAVQAYWFLLFPAVVAACFAVAQAFGGGKRPD